ncbi:hypothetical protein RB595_003482 [Gaeumannomyces hyphopodioides]
MTKPAGVSLYCSLPSGGRPRIPLLRESQPPEPSISGEILTLKDTENIFALVYSSDAPGRPPPPRSLRHSLMSELALVAAGLASRTTSREDIMVGEDGPITNKVSLAEAMVMAGFLSVSLWNTLQTTIFIFQFFKRFSGLYFWSISAANFGIPLRQVTALLRFFGLAPNLAMLPISSVGFWMMVTGQSVVLYSRLSLIVGAPETIRWVALVVAATFLLVEVPTSAVLLASNMPHGAALVPVFTAMENVQTGLLTLQETTISALYVVAARRALRPMEAIKGRRVRSTLRQLAGLFALTVVLDLSLMGLQYSGRQFAVMTTYKGVVYSIKLQVEAVVLNNLTCLVRQRPCTCHSTPADNFSSSLRGTTAAQDGIIWSGAQPLPAPSFLRRPSMAAAGSRTPRSSRSGRLASHDTQGESSAAAELREIFKAESTSTYSRKDPSPALTPV